jgi:hypothetical protein
MSAIWYSSGSFVAGNQRAQTIAWYDYVKAELPDVWFVQNTNPGNTDYPINFAAYPYPGTAMSGTSTAVTAVSHYILPLGNNINPPTVTSGSYGDGGVTYPNLFPSGSGIYGASYGAAAGLYKNLGFSPNGYDGVDNNGNGLIDEFGEGGNSTVTGNLANHKHVTARSEMLYALLVEGRGPLGSSFKPDDFTEREVQDTDGDGLPEFIDAWGQPLQFFRWPVFYHSDIQRGQVTITSANISQYTTAYTNGTPALTAPNVGDFAPPYLTVFEQREINPLDQNSQLVAPSWWSTGGKTSTLGTSGIAANSNSPFSGAVVPSGVSGSVSLFEALFHPLTEPYNALGSHTRAYSSTTTPRSVGSRPPIWLLRLLSPTKTTQCNSGSTRLTSRPELLSESRTLAPHRRMIPSTRTHLTSSRPGKMTSAIIIFRRRVESEARDDRQHTA